MLDDLKNRAPARQQTPEKSFQLEAAGWGQIVWDTYERLTRFGFHAEAKELLAIARAEVKRGEAKSEEIHRILSLSWLSILLQVGEPALIGLPVLFHANFEFFSGEVWIRRLLADWHQRGERDKIQQALFGPRKGKRGIRSYQLAMNNLQRNRKIIAEAERLLKSDIGHNEAMRQVAANLKALGIPERLSVAAVTKIYRERQAETSRLLTILLPAPPSARGR